MELKTGYKQTEVGVIPSDWEVKAFKEICTPSKERMNPLLTFSSFKCIELEHLSQETGRLLGYADSKELKSQKSVFNENDVLFGKLRPYLRKFYFATFNGVCTTEIWVLKSKVGVDHKWLYFLIQSSTIIDAANQSTGTKMPRAEWKTVGDTNVALPPTLSEQTAIATALSDTDQYITHLEKLIAKKRNIKQGAMQELLKPKEGWVVKKLGEVGKIVTGSTPPTQISAYWNGSIPWVTPTDISNFEKNIHITEREVSAEGLEILRKLPENTLLVTCIASIGKNAILKKAGACNQQINAIIPNSGHDVDFLYYLIENNRHYILSKAGITATLIISKNDFSEIEFFVPSSKDEQMSIATILSDMDSEIATLEAKLSKAQSIKLGMMQQLLTGKIRLV